MEPEQRVGANLFDQHHQCSPLAGRGLDESAAFQEIV